MRKKLTLLLAVIVSVIVTVQAQQALSWMGNSFIFIGDTPGTALWCTGSNAYVHDGGLFNGKNLGTIGSLKIGGEVQTYAGNNSPTVPLSNVTVWLNYRIDTGPWQQIAMTKTKFENNNDFWQTPAGTEVITGALSPGAHTISVYFNAVRTSPSQTAQDNNGGSYFVANFNIAAPTTITLNVNVPAGTETCYVAGSWDGWATHLKMDPALPSYDFTIDIPVSGNIEYKYCSGPDWKYEELDGTGKAIANRELLLANSPSNDAVLEWKAVYVPKFIEFTTPATSMYVAELNETVTFVAETIEPADLVLYSSVKGSGMEILVPPLIGTTSISHAHTFNVSGSYWIIAEATTSTSEVIRDSVFVVVKKPVTILPRMATLPDGINIIDEHTVTFILCAPGKNDVFVVGDFNDWLPDNDYLMNQDGDYWWLEVSGLDPDVEYAFQYLVDGNLYVADPYAEKILDPWNDKYIPDCTYPDLKTYPAGKNTDDGPVSVFRTNEAAYDYAWEMNNFTPPRQDKLVIYEILIRDFTNTSCGMVDDHIGDLNGVMTKLDYLQGLGINAIELMPTQEFDGNDSWGYSPCFYFAMDKAYGTKNMYKQFIDECHKRGIAVILDVVYNHATGLHPFAKLYWDAVNNKTTTENPWFNVDAPHPYSVFHDFNHEEPMVREFFKRNLKFLLEEYRFDGFRFDLTKGFTQQSSDEGSAGNYDASRIAILKDYQDAILAVNPQARMIIEHFCVDDEERALGDHENGIMPWSNKSYAYAQAEMGWQIDSDFNGINAWTRGVPSWDYDNLIGYMESHDEERMVYKDKEWGATDDIQTNLAVQMKRAALCAAFSLPIPGAKMIWQFGELGYDVSIDHNGRTGRKPVLWNYYDIPERRALYDTYSKLIRLRDYYEEADWNDKSSWGQQIEEGSWNNGRRIALEKVGLEFKLVIIGNFNPNTSVTTYPHFPEAGIWYDLIGGGTLNVTDPDMTIDLDVHEFRVYTNKELFTPIVWTGTTDTDWDEPTNWNDGLKRRANSIVTIPAGVPNFPVLVEDTYVGEIHFNPGAQIGGQSYLKGKAFVQYDLSDAERWHMLSMPLEEAYPGDFAFGGYPLTWVRMFETSTEGSVTKGGWFTAQAREDALTFGDGFVLWLDKDESSVAKGLKQLPGKIRELPFFQHHAAGSSDSLFYESVNQSHFYDGTNSIFWNFEDKGSGYVRGDLSYSVPRTGNRPYQLAGTAVTKTLEFGTNAQAGGGDVTLVGNPYMAALDFLALADANGDVIKPLYHIWIGSSADNGGGYQTWSEDGSAGLVIDNPSLQFIAPLQGFLLEQAKSSEYDLEFKESMTSINNNAVLRSSATIVNKLDIVARNPIAGVRTFIAQRAGGQTEFGNSDARKIINGISNVPEIYTLKPYKGGSVATAINLINSDELLIPVGLATSYEGNITLSFSGMDRYDANLSLIDAETNETIDLTGLPFYDYEINYTPKKINGAAAVCEDRFFIRISSSTFTGLKETAGEKVSVYESSGLIRIVSGTSNPIKEVAVYDLQGALIYKAAPIHTVSHTVALNRPCGVYIVKVISEKNTNIVKLIIK